MNRELNIEPILALDKQIAQLQRTRNSLLNVARIPPEILGRIFRFAIIVKTGDPDFAGIQHASYKFLLVCHHWHEVALRTPELWCSWGDSLKDWKWWHSRSGTSVLDLALNAFGYPHGILNGTLQAALRDRATRDAIRKVHLKCWEGMLLDPILSSLTPENNIIRPSSIKSIKLAGHANPSNFFARHFFPKLQDLSLSGCPDFALGPLKSCTTALVNLSLSNSIPTCISTPSTSQIISILAANPNLRTLKLKLEVLDNDSKRGSGVPVPLHHLEEFSLEGRAADILPILDRLELRGAVNQAHLDLSDCTLEETRKLVGPYLRDHLQRDPRFGDGLGISLRSTPNYISICVAVVGIGYHGPEQLPQRDPPRARFRLFLNQHAPPEEMTKMFIDTFAPPPRGRVTYFETRALDIEEILAVMPNIEFLHLTGVNVSDGFLQLKPDGPNTNKIRLLPSLRRLYLEDMTAVNGDWGHLIRYLASKTFDSQTVSLSVFGEEVHICSEAVRQLEELVEEFIYLPDDEYYRCFRPGCGGDEEQWYEIW